MILFKEKKKNKKEKRKKNPECNGIYTKQNSGHSIENQLDEIRVTERRTNKKSDLKETVTEIFKVSYQCKIIYCMKIYYQQVNLFALHINVFDVN